jgi:hypothetical protein
MKRATLFALAALFVLPDLAFAGVEAAFGNTILMTYPDGRQGRLWLAADGTYTAEGRRRTPSSGKWRVKGDRICLTQLKPVRGPFSHCTRAPDGGIGTTWTARAVTGETITVKVMRGRV